MNRKTFDKIASIIGLLLAVVLIAAGAMLQWGANFANKNVKEQLVSQKITMPAVDSPSFNALPADAQKALKPFSGQPMTNGDQAEAFANHYIGVHLLGVAGGKVYEEVSGEFLAANAELKNNPTDTALQAKVAQLGGQRTTLFMGETLRGLLLNAYAFGTLGKIAMTASYVMFLGGILFLILALLGFAHLRRAATDSVI
jgi:hypothetical protein